MERIEPVLEDEHPDLVIVLGDINSTLVAVSSASRSRTWSRACAPSTERWARRSTGIVARNALAYLFDKPLWPPVTTAAGTPNTSASQNWLRA
jgi:hypothetical protein